MEVIVLEQLSHLPKGIPFLSVGMVSDVEAARKIGDKYRATTVYYWPKTKTAFVFHSKEDRNGVHEAL